nr:MAG TPA: hypothetical protein [Caudoviricetes sp.]
MNILHEKEEKLRKLLESTSLLKVVKLYSEMLLHMLQLSIIQKF